MRSSAAAVAVSYIMCFHYWGSSDDTKWIADSAEFGEVTQARATGDSLGDALGDALSHALGEALGGSGDMDMSSVED
jgi:hypothetical protein